MPKLQPLGAHRRTKPLRRGQPGSMRIFPCLFLSLALAAGNALATDFWHNDAPAVLDASRAFQLMPVEQQNGRLRVQWEIVPGYYMYRERMKFEVVEPAGVELGAVTLPAGEKMTDEHFGKVEIYRGGVLNADFHPAKSIRKLKIGYQGCAETGICLPPQSRIVDVEQVRTE